MTACPRVDGMSREFPRDIADWWPALPEHVRAQIADDPAAELSTEAVIAITKTRGVGPASAAWIVGEPHDSGKHRFYLTESEQEWVAERAG